MPLVVGLGKSAAISAIESRDKVLSIGEEEHSFVAKFKTCQTSPTLS